MNATGMPGKSVTSLSSSAGTVTVRDLNILVVAVPVQIHFTTPSHGPQVGGRYGGSRWFNYSAGRQGLPVPRPVSRRRSTRHRALCARPRTPSLAGDLPVDLPTPVHVSLRSDSDPADLKLATETCRRARRRPRRLEPEHDSEPSRRGNLQQRHTYGPGPGTTASQWQSLYPGQCQPECHWH